MRPAAVVAVDLGASSGRCLLGRFDGKRLAVEEVYRFPNQPVRFNGHLRWNVAALHHEIVTGLAACARKQRAIRSVGVDTWGVDYALLGPGDALLDLPIAYRDERTAGCMQEVVALVGRERIYCETGIQFLPFNTLYQLYAASRRDPEAFASARHLLMMPDLFAFLLSGIRAGEYTDASTTQMLHVHDRNWSTTLLDGLGLPSEILPKVVAPGTILGELRPAIAAETGLSHGLFTATATHDTASAVAGVPAAASTRWAFISCGTWSLVGRELGAPLVTPGALAENFTNEGGVAGTIRFLKNVQGMWMLQQCQREWAAAGHALSSAELTHLATKAPAFAVFLDPDDEVFLNPPSMLKAIADYCRRTRQCILRMPGAVARAVLEALALKYRRTLRVLAQLTETPVDLVHMVGGGSRNRLLCRLTADATGTPVVAGPAEATAIGNILVQGIALCWFANLEQARGAVARSVRMQSFQPRHEPWDEAERRFQQVLERAQAQAAHA
jgi:rhamnulokinase